MKEHLRASACYLPWTSLSAPFPILPALHRASILLEHRLTLPSCTAVPPSVALLLSPSCPLLLAPHYVHVLLNHFLTLPPPSPLRLSAAGEGGGRLCAGEAHHHQRPQGRRLLRAHPDRRDSGGQRHTHKGVLQGQEGGAGWWEHMCDGTLHCHRSLGLGVVHMMGLNTRVSFKVRSTGGLLAGGSMCVMAPTSM